MGWFEVGAAIVMAGLPARPLAPAPGAGVAQETPTAQPTSLQPPMPTAVAPEPATPAQAPPTPVPTEPREEPPPPPPEATAVPPEEGQPARPPLRTPRPTRTARAVTPTVTPVSAAALRLTLRSEAPNAAGGQAELLVRLVNQSPADAAGLVIEVSPPPGADVRDAEALTGAAGRAGPAVQWLIPHLAAGATTRLTLRVVLPETGTSAEWCAVLLSSGAPLELCVPVGTGSGSAELVPELELPPLAAGAQPERAPDAGPLRYGLVMLGLLLLGLWLGPVLSARRSAAESSSGDLAVDAVEGVGIGREEEATGVAGDDLED